jgi:hypothetical protein
MLEFPFAYAYLLFPAAVALGALEGSLVPQKCVTVAWWQATAIHAVVTFAMAWSVIEYVAVEEDFRVTRFETLNIGQTKTNYEKPAFHLLTQLGAMLDFALVPSR